MTYSLENGLFQWEDGRRVLESLRDDLAERRRADRVIAAVHDELRRQIGATFRAVELAELYAQGTDPYVTIAQDSAPGLQTDPQSLVDAAFWLYLRKAGDFAGGRELIR